MVADYVVLESDLLHESASDISEIPILDTAVAGESVFSAQSKQT